MFEEPLKNLNFYENGTDPMHFLSNFEPFPLKMAKIEKKKKKKKKNPGKTLTIGLSKCLFSRFRKKYN